MSASSTIVIAIELTPEQLERLDAIASASGFTRDEQIGAMIDLDFEEWQDPDDAVLHDASRSSRYARFVAADAAAATATAPGHVTIETMPDHLRDSHRAAGNWGVYPLNGAERRQVTREEADEIVAADTDGYDHIVAQRGQS